MYTTYEPSLGKDMNTPLYTIYDGMKAPCMYSTGGRMVYNAWFKSYGSSYSFRTYNLNQDCFLKMYSTLSQEISRLLLCSQNLYLISYLSYFLSLFSLVCPFPFFFLSLFLLSFFLLSFFLLSFFLSFFIQATEL